MKSSPEFSLLNAGVYTLLFCFALTVTFGRNYTGMVRPSIYFFIIFS